MKDNERDNEPHFEWLFCQWYEGAENQATEALLKWFCYSSSSAQRQFLMKLCGLKKIPRKKFTWDEMEIQAKSKRSVPDGKIWLEKKYVLLVEGKIRENTVSLKQLKRHFKGIGFKPQTTHHVQETKLLLLTPDWGPPAKLQRLADGYQRSVVWVNWQHVFHFLTKDLKPKNSADRLLRDGIVDFLRVHDALKKYFQA